MLARADDFSRLVRDSRGVDDALRKARAAGFEDSYFFYYLRFGLGGERR